MAPDYAILSHRWYNAEVSFADLSKASPSPLRSRLPANRSIRKLQGVCKLARENGYMWIWIDSCCIDKSSSVELQEAINSMWRYYAESNVCYVYLEDVADWEAGWGADFAASSWFTRGWTLQELIAPRRVEFYAEDWAAVGTKLERFKEISKITSIDPDLLLGLRNADDFSAAQRLSWASHRNVTREEDEAYSLIGLFHISLEPLYGEGREKAFVRLQEAVYKETADHSIFLFRQSQYKEFQPLLASSPKYFCDRRHCELCSAQGTERTGFDIRYNRIFTSDGWLTQTHEPIMTTFTMSRNEATTDFELLEYEAVSKNLHYVGRDSLRHGVTHVAILNHTPREHKKGAFCLLLCRESGDAFSRVQILPAVIYDLERLRSRPRKSKTLICAGEKNEDTNSAKNFVFLFRSGTFRTKRWDLKEVTNREPEADADDDPEEGIEKPWTRLSAGLRAGLHFKVQARLQDKLLVICRVRGIQRPHLSLDIQIRQICGIWSIHEISGSKEHTKGCEMQILFSSVVPTDRCEFQFPDEHLLKVALHRLPGSARGCLKDATDLQCYKLFVA
ncbi:hypothetical protein E8E13_000575 [Curvularia kusanoi]|uniref:Heterokaryon incompatibility domain-containing protein n=1 Tax=Curvularia kusanoi TaxID=90978 RepID=A0A9P4TAK3_CURKU|nr:hypothetical protein E8E13_000575 [Curvularia kusanoi]